MRLTFRNNFLHGAVIFQGPFPKQSAQFENTGFMMQQKKAGWILWGSCKKTVFSTTLWKKFVPESHIPLNTIQYIYIYIYIYHIVSSKTIYRNDKSKEYTEKIKNRSPLSILSAIKTISTNALVMEMVLLLRPRWRWMFTPHMEEWSPWGNVPIWWVWKYCTYYGF